MKIQLTSFSSILYRFVVGVVVKATFPQTIQGITEYKFGDFELEICDIFMLFSIL